MWYVLIDDIETHNGHMTPGTILSQDGLNSLVKECDCVNIVAFTCKEHAEQYVRVCLN